MKKILILIVSLFLLTGCDTLMNTPTKRVENLLSKYQQQDSEVLTQLDNTLRDETLMNSEQKNRYRDLMMKQYDNLAYTIKDETVDGRTAVVEVEIEVYDYNKAISEAEDYLLNNITMFQDDSGNVNNSRYNDYKIEQMEKVKDKITYTINFTLSQVDDKWLVDDLTETERMKLHGLYAY